ncbi:uncharacterized protein LOC144883820 [Branchiostoma floridae x Branchiostoma japonicum]
MGFSNLIENPMVVIELYGGYVGWILMTCLVATVVAICVYCLVRGFQNKQTEEGDSLPQPAQLDESRVEDISFVEDVSPQQDDHESLTCPICRSDSCDDDHESTFLFHREQYKDHSNEEHIKLTQGRGEDKPLTIFEEIGEFKRLKTVTIIGVRIGYPSLLNLLQCSSVRSLKLVSCQIACVPRCLAKLKDLEILDLSHNNLTTLPGRSLHSLPCLKSLNLSHNNITTIGSTVRKLRAVQNFDVSFNKITEIPYEVLEMQNLKNFSCSHNKIKRWLDPTYENMLANTAPLKFLNLSNNSLEEVPRYVKDLKNLSVVNISDNKIWRADVSDEIQSHQLAELFYLPSVSKLVLGNNNIKTLPLLDMAKVSPNIELIDLTNNEIREVPAGLLLMTHLKVLLLGNNNITKLPTDLDLNKLSPTLSIIDLSSNELDDMPLALCFLTSLEKLDLKQNKISTLSENVKSCKSLAFLDVSGNKLKDIPSHVIELPKLLEIRASNNQINSFSSLRKDNPSVVEVIALAKNGLSHFPEVLTQMGKLKKVDLSNNDIKVIPQSVMDMPKNVRLDLRDNPIIDPPLQVCQAGLQAIQAFYEDLTTASSITQCLKTLFLGTYEAGKTSLVRVFQLNRSMLTKPEERTHGIEIADLQLSAPNTPDITLSVWDFAGQETYYITHQFFLSAKALILLVVNLEEYDSASFNSACGDWMENMIAKVGNPVVIPVATHIDKLSTGETKRRCEDLAKRLEDQERMRIKDLERQLQRIDESLLVVESPGQNVAANDRKKQIEALLRKRPSIHSNPIPVSSAEALDGIQYLKQVILNYAVNKEFFPEVGRPIPKAWADTEACVERKGEEMSLPYMTWDEFTSLLKENVPNLQPESRIKTVSQYLHDTGKILWYSEIESLRKHVFLKPASLVDIFRKVIRHDLETVINYESDPCYREAEIAPTEFEKMKNDLVRKGILHTKLLRCLWTDVEKECRSGKFSAIFDVLIELMRQFDLCYDIEEHAFGLRKTWRSPWMTYNEHIFKSTTQHHSSRRLLLPWHIKEDLKDRADSQWETAGMSVISLQYQFPSFIPPGLFARLTVRAHNPKHNLHFVAHWSTGTLCKHIRSRVLVLLKYEDVKGFVVSLSARPEVRRGYGALTTLHPLWETLKELSLEVEDLLKQWPGVRFDRSTVCPECLQATFPGNWLHPSSGRGLGAAICSNCDDRIPVEYLVPPQPDAGIDEADWPPLHSQRRGYVFSTPPTVVSDRQLSRVAKKLGSEWENLAIHLGFHPADVYRFKCDHRDSTLNKIFAMLAAWKKRKGRNATKEKLQRALVKAEVDIDVISCLDERERSFAWPSAWAREAYEDTDSD